jgi:short subunit dehydrogenase-like uncharacterized protein
MIYGATGFTGALIAEEAVVRGHRPTLAGRDAGKLRRLAERLGLEYAVLPLNDAARLRRALERVYLVLHCAGPFTMTADPMRRACLDTKTHYLDITGEIEVFEGTFALDSEAQAADIVMISGVGFDVLPTDSMCKYVADKLPGADLLEMAISTAAFGQPSAGTTGSMIEIMKMGGQARRGGELKQMALGTGAREVQFPFGKRWTMPIPWGDLATAYRSTGVRNIITYMRYRPDQIRLVRWFSPLAKALFQFKPARRLVQAVINRTLHGPSEYAREHGKSVVWACASCYDGQSAEAWLETGEAYEFTKIATVSCVEAVLGEEFTKRGALSPSQAFGADFVLGMPGVRRIDSLPS